MSRLSKRALALAQSGGNAAKTWEKLNALAARPGMLNMSQGFPDFLGSSIARRVAAEAAKGGTPTMNQYSPQPGLVELRSAVSDFVHRRYGAPQKYDPASEVVVTAGGQEALAAAFLAYLDPGDEVVLFEPFYPFMLGAVRQAGAIPKVVTLKPPGFGIDEAALRAAAASPKAKMLILNSPHNPTGHVVTPRELELVADVCKENDLLALSDEVYEHCIFPNESGIQHLQLANVDGMRERTITFGSGGKLFALTGWRVAWAYGPASLMGPLGASHTHLTFSAPTPLQAGIAAALREDEASLDETAINFSANFEMLASALRRGTTASAICEAHGGYFLVAQTDGRSDVEWCQDLAETKGVVCTPMSVFYATPFEEDDPCRLVRFTVCKSHEHVQKVCEALVK